MQPIGKVVSSITKPLFRKKPQMALMMNWPLIVGEELARDTWPLKIVSAKAADSTLYVSIQASRALEVWGKSALLLHRINQYFGHEAIQRVRLTKKSFSGIGSSKPPSL